MRAATFSAAIRCSRSMHGRGTCVNGTLSGRLCAPSGLPVGFCFHGLDHDGAQDAAYDSADPEVIHHRWCRAMLFCHCPTAEQHQQAHDGGNQHGDAADSANMRTLARPLLVRTFAIVRSDIRKAVTHAAVNDGPTPNMMAVTPNAMRMENLRACSS